MFDIIATTKDEWRELGFYYKFDKENHKWLLVGSREGLSNFSKILNDYVSKDRNKMLGEHEHLRPYDYLTIVTSETAKLTDYGVFGSLSDLRRLSELINNVVSISKPGDTTLIDTEYSNNNEAILSLEIKENGFDPSEADDFAWVQK